MFAGFFLKKISLETIKTSYKSVWGFYFIAHRKDLEYPKLSMKFDSEVILFKDVREPYGRAVIVFGCM